MKTCSKCHFTKDEFHFSKGGRGYLKSQCKDCDKQYRLDHKAEQKVYDKQYYQNVKKPIYDVNKPLFKEKNAKYYKENREDVISKVREYAEENIDKVKENKKRYYEENKEATLAKGDIYYINNLPVIKERAREYRLTHKDARNKHSKDRYDNDPAFKLRILVSTAIGKSLKNTGSSKGDKSSSKYLPYTIEGLRTHLEAQFEPWMSWDHQGKYDPKTWDDNNPTTWTWNIDHIVPQSKLTYSSLDNGNFQKSWALSNLRPLSAKQNIIDGNRR
jgi:hypothetical protein